MDVRSGSLKLLCKQHTLLHVGLNTDELNPRIGPVEEQVQTESKSFLWEGLFVDVDLVDERMALVLVDGNPGVEMLHRRVVLGDLTGDFLDVETLLTGIEILFFHFIIS